MDEQTKNLIIKTIIFIVILVICIITYHLLMNSVLGKALSNLLGDTEAILALTGRQLNTCNKNGFFNVNKGCYLGVAGLGIGILFVVFKFASLWVNSKSDLVNKVSTLTETSTSDIVSKSLEDIDIDRVLENEDLTTRQKVDVIQKALTEKISRNGQEAVKAQSKTSATIESQIKDILTEADIAKQEINDSARKDGETEEDIQESDQLADEIIE